MAISGCDTLRRLQALRWKDIDLERGRLNVFGTLTAVSDGVPVFGEPKTQHSRRTVGLSETAVEALERHRASQDERHARHSKVGHAVL